MAMNEQQQYRRRGPKPSPSARCQKAPCKWMWHGARQQGGKVRKREIWQNIQVGTVTSHRCYTEHAFISFVLLPSFLPLSLSPVACGTGYTEQKCRQSKRERYNDINEGTDRHGPLLKWFCNPLLYDWAASFCHSFCPFLFAPFYPTEIWKG